MSKTNVVSQRAHLLSLQAAGKNPPDHVCNIVSAQLVAVLMSISRFNLCTCQQAQTQDALASVRASLGDKEEELASAQRTIEGLWDATMEARTGQVRAVTC